MGLPLQFLAAGSVGAQSLVVVNQGDATVTVIDPSAKRVVATIPEQVTGVHGHEVVVSPDGRTAFVPIYGSAGVGQPGIDGHEVLVIDVPSRKIIDRIEFSHGVRPHLPVFDARRNVVYVTTELDKTITAIDPATHRVLYAIPTGAEQSHMLVLSHDGRFGYTANVGPGSVSVMDLERRKVVAVVPVASSVQRIAISPDDKWVFTSDVAKPRLAVIDTSTNQVARWITLPAEGYGAGATANGLLLIALPRKNQVAVINLKTMAVERTVDVAVAPQEVLIRPDQKVAYVSCVAVGKVAAIDLTTWKVAIIDSGSNSDGLAWAK